MNIIEKLLFCILATLLPTNPMLAQANTKKEAPKDLEIWCNDGATAQQWLLDPSFDQEAEDEAAKNGMTNDNRYFNRFFLRQTHHVRALLAAEGAQSGQLALNDSNGSSVFNFTLLGRKSDTLLVIGPGYPVPRERMAPYVKLFPSYDLLFFDYRGQGIDHCLGWSALLPWRWKGALTYWLFDTDFNTTCLGTSEEAEVIALVQHVRKQYRYRHIYGLGLCFSSYTFVKAAATQPWLFDKLILDGSWPALDTVIKKIAADPYLICATQPPQSPLPYVTHTDCFQNSALTLLEWILWINIREAKQLIDYLPAINCPVLFFQSREDCYCPLATFKTLWQATPAPKVAVLTNNVHGRNHIWQKGAYAMLSHWFLENNSEEFMQLIDQTTSQPTKVPLSKAVDTTV